MHQAEDNLFVSLCESFLIRIRLTGNIYPNGTLTYNISGSRSLRKLKFRDISKLLKRITVPKIWKKNILFSM